MSEYHDRWIDCTDEEIRIRGYYFPWGTKRIPYKRIRSWRTVPLTATRGKARIWGTANPRYWASLDPGRPRKSTALILDVGAAVKPFVTPDDPQAVAAIIRQKTGLESSGDAPGPIV